MASKYNGTLYIGVTSNLLQRVWQHKQGTCDGFTRQYKVKLLVYYETYQDINDAIICERRMKEWHRAWKIRVIEERNPTWADLWPEMSGEADGPRPAPG